MKRIIVCLMLYCPSESNWKWCEITRRSSKTFVRKTQVKCVKVCDDESVEALTTIQFEVSSLKSSLLPPRHGISIVFLQEGLKNTGNRLQWKQNERQYHYLSWWWGSSSRNTRKQRRRRRRLSLFFSKMIVRPIVHLGLSRPIDTTS